MELHFAELWPTKVCFDGHMLLSKAYLTACHLRMDPFLPSSSPLKCIPNSRHL